MIRATLGLSVEEAANHILEVAPAAWEAWESSDIIVPGWVLSKIASLNDRQQSMLDVMGKLIIEEGVSPIIYDTYASYLLDHPESSFISWRLTASVANHYRDKDSSEPHFKMVGQISLNPDDDQI